MQPQHHQLSRSEGDKRIAGVCGGLAEYFDVDPIIVRIIFVASIFFGGLGILLYIALWIVMPRGTPGASSQRTAGRGSSAIRIAEERFARGEITAQELSQIRADLTGRP